MTQSESDSYQIRFLPDISSIEAEQWNALAGDAYPFMKHEFFLALEQSGSTTSRTGWQPFHAVLEQSTDDVTLPIAIMPLYLKSNSRGEYVFDWSWIDAYERHGIPYFPKLVSAIPFTPCPGPRICINREFNEQEIYKLLIDSIQKQAEIMKASSWHILFPEQALSDALNESGVQQRLGCQYQWFNEDFSSFNHFLDKFSSRKRKNIRKERKRVTDAGITFELLTGKDIKDDHWQHFFQFYQNTYLVRGRPPYLNEKFFELAGQLMADNLLLILAKKDENYIAGALSFIGSDTLYGRYWGCSEAYEFLHFETCFYQGIEFCIEKGLSRFDSGAQGEHKIQRGFEPVLTYSNHWIAHPDFDRAIGQFLDEEERYIRDYQDRAREYLPFKQTSENNS